MWGRKQSIQILARVGHDVFLSTSFQFFLTKLPHIYITQEAVRFGMSSVGYDCWSSPDFNMENYCDD